jgi:hypothetical protein
VANPAALWNGEQIPMISRMTSALIPLDEGEMRCGSGCQWVDIDSMRTNYQTDANEHCFRLAGGGNERGTPPRRVQTGFHRGDRGAACCGWVARSTICYLSVKLRVHSAGCGAALDDLLAVPPRSASHHPAPPRPSLALPDRSMRAPDAPVRPGLRRSPAGRRDHAFRLG